MVVSDLLQNESGFSLYKAVPADRRLLADALCIFAARQPHRHPCQRLHAAPAKAAAKQTDALGKFWIDWLERQGAQVDAFKSVPG